LELLLLLLGAVVLLGGLLRLLVELVDLGLHRVLARLLGGRGVGTLRAQDDGSCCSGGEHGHTCAVRLLGTTVGRHGGELLLPPAAYRHAGGRGPPPSPPHVNDYPSGGSRPDPSDSLVISSNPWTRNLRHSTFLCHELMCSDRVQTLRCVTSPANSGKRRVRCGWGLGF